jgi:hypothetical protein
MGNMDQCYQQNINIAAGMVIAGNFWTGCAVAIWRPWMPIAPRR